jgi:hypothetical protein
VVISLLDRLATTMRIRLSSRTREAAWAGPDATTVGVVFAGSLGPVATLPTFIRIAVTCQSVGPDAMAVGGFFTGRPAFTGGPEDGLLADRTNSEGLALRRTAGKLV